MIIINKTTLSLILCLLLLLIGFGCLPKASYHMEGYEVKPDRSEHGTVELYCRIVCTHSGSSSLVAGHSVYGAPYKLEVEARTYDNRWEDLTIRKINIALKDKTIKILEGSLSDQVFQFNRSPSRHDPHENEHKEIVYETEAQFPIELTWNKDKTAEITVLFSLTSKGETLNGVHHCKVDAYEINRESSMWDAMMGI